MIGFPLSSLFAYAKQRFFLVLLYKVISSCSAFIFLKILYATQAQTKPPTFIIFVNNKELFHFSYERYLVNQIRSNFDLEGTPIRIISREKREKEI